jgi:hypothetical protein
MDTPVAKPSPHQSDFNDRCAQVLSLLIQNGWMAVTVSGKPHKTTRMAFGQIELLNHLPDSFTLDLWG